MRYLTLPLALASCGIGLTLSPHAHALSFGMLKVHSYLEQPLDATLSYSNNPGEVSGIAERNCIEIDRDKSSDSGLPVVNRIQLQIDGNDVSGTIRLRSSHALSEPVAVIRLRNSCDNTNIVVREFTFFLDPQPQIRYTDESTSAAPVQLPKTLSAAPKPRKQIDVPTHEIWTVKRGDTLTAITRHFQANREGQKQLAKAILASNPQIKNPNLIELGAQLVIPELSALYASNAATPEGEEAPAGAASRAVQRNKQQTPASADKAPAVRYAKAPGSESEPSYKLKLSPTRNEGDSTGKSDEAAQTGQGKRNNIDSDDKTAEMLALNEKISQLEEQMHSLRVQLQLQTTPPAAAPAKAAAKPAATAAPQPALDSTSETGDGLPLWLLAPAGGVLVAGLGYLQWRRRNA